MPRGARVILPQIAVHIRQRGHDGRDCFRHETDYVVYLSNLRELSAAKQCTLHAYCLMTNHVHLLLTPANPQACALLMRNLGQRYVQYFNRRYQRNGTLWEGRFRSCLVDSAIYVLACHRYIELNPVRAGMVRSASDYRWSSHQVNAGRTWDDLLSPHAEYLALGTDDASRHAAYLHLFASGDDPAFVAAIRNATDGGYALVGDRLKAALPSDTQRRLARRPPGPPADGAPQQDKDAAQATLELGLRPRT
jgi:putative transposase